MLIGDNFKMEQQLLEMNEKLAILIGDYMVI